MSISTTTTQTTQKTARAAAAAAIEPRGHRWSWWLPGLSTPPEPFIKGTSAPVATTAPEQQMTEQHAPAPDTRPAAVRALRRTCLLQHVGEKDLEALSAKLERIDFKRGDQLGAAQGEPQDALYVVTKGTVYREVVKPNTTQRHVVREDSCGMGDAPSAFKVTGHALRDGRRARITVRGPDVDGLLSGNARALFSAGAKIVSAAAECPRESDDESQVRAETTFVVELMGSSSVDDVTASSEDARTPPAVPTERRRRRTSSTEDTNPPMDAPTAKRLAAVVQASCEAAALGALRTTGPVNSFGTLHCVGELPAFATTVAATDGIAWRVPSKAITEQLRGPGKKNTSDFAVDVASGLCAEIFRMSESYAPTPLFEQQPKRVNVAAVSVAAAFESYYRSLLNALLNSSLSGTTGATMFPNMHVQIPTRVAYINGFKFLRQSLNDLVETRVEHNAFYRLVPALLPGVLMTPVSSILEACNAGHANAEPLWLRATRGGSFRTAREVIFGLGLNNMADYCEESVPPSIATSKLARNALGSVVAGVVAGYLSHVPHNLSTLKMLDPSKSYAQHWGSLVHIARTTRLPKALPPTSAGVLANLLTLFVPAGLAIRTTQIVGSFCLLNGLSHALA